MTRLVQSLNFTMSISSPETSVLWNSILDRKLSARLLARRVGFVQASESRSREFRAQEGIVKLNNSRPAVVRAVTFESPAKLIGERTQEEVIRAVQNMKPPEFIHPYPSRENRHTARAIANSYTWFDQQSLPTLFPDPMRLQQFVRGNLNRSFVGIFVDAEEQEMSWLCCYSLWAFLLDDLLDDLSARAPDRSTAIVLDLNLVMMCTFPDNPSLYSTFLELLDLVPEEHRDAMLDNVDAKLANARQHPGSVYCTTDLGPMITSYQDLWEKFVSATPPESAIRWGNAMQRYFLGNLGEISNRNQGGVPSIVEYIALRRKSSAMESCMFLVDYADKFTTSFPSELLNTPEMKSFLIAVNDSLGWHNDVFSFKKELLDGEMHNLAYVVSHERGCSFSDGLEIALGMLHERLRDLDRAIADLEAISTLENRWAVSAYVKSAKHWVSGSHAFTINSIRYR